MAQAKKRVYKKRVIKPKSNFPRNFGITGCCEIPIFKERTKEELEIDDLKNQVYKLQREVENYKEAIKIILS